MLSTYAALWWCGFCNTCQSVSYLQKLQLCFHCFQSSVLFVGERDGNNEASSDKTDVHNEENIFSLILSLNTDIPELIRCVRWGLLKFKKKNNKWWHLSVLVYFLRCCQLYSCCYCSCCLVCIFLQLLLQ